jgi:ankyrin repeat protein
MVAAYMNQPSSIRLLMKAGADLELKGGPKGYTALMMAIVARNPQIVETLLEYKPDPGALAHDGSSALYLASCKGDCDIMRMLIKAGAVVDQEDERGMTVLTTLMKEFHSNTGTLLQAKLEEVKNVLIEAGADLQHKDKDGKSWYVKPVEWTE